MTTITTPSEVLLDTSVVIALTRGRLPAVDVRGAISTMTLAELEFGVARAVQPAERTARMRALTDVRRVFRTLVIDDAVARDFGTLRAALHAEGRRPGIADVLIAATALAHGLTLLTADAEQAAFPGLQTHLIQAPGA